jgi:hypothetical protein
MRYEDETKRALRYRALRRIRGASDQKSHFNNHHNSTNSNAGGMT